MSCDLFSKATDKMQLLSTMQNMSESLFIAHLPHATNFSIAYNYLLRLGVYKKLLIMNAIYL